MSKSVILLKSKRLDKIVGNNLKKLRKDRALSQEEIGKEIGVTFQQIQKYENASNRISASTLYVLSKILDVQLTDFYLDSSIDDTELPSEITSKQNAYIVDSFKKIKNPKIRKKILDLLNTITDS